MWWIIVGLTVAITSILFAWLMYKKQVAEIQAKLQKQFVEQAQRLYADLERQRSYTEEYWKQQFEDWKTREIGTIRLSLEERYRGLLDQWKMEFEQQIRQDAISRSKSVVIGQITEHLVPFMQDFKYNPKDVRFLGTPVDLIVFDGLTDGQLKRIVLIEVKSGANKQLSIREKQVRDATLQGLVSWELYYRPLLDNTKTSDTTISEQNGPTEQ